MNFALILLLLSIGTGAIWCYDRFILRRARIASAEKALAAFDGSANHLDEAARAKERELLRLNALRQPAWVEYTGGFFPVIVVVFFLRSFVAEPFRIPSGSMIPTLLVGDLILVNKFTYGIRLPVADTKIIEVGSPKRGDVMVFRYPNDESENYIKRVVGLPGDTVVYENKRLTINGQAVPMTKMDDYFDDSGLLLMRQYNERLGAVEHRVILNERRPPATEHDNFRFVDQCTYNAVGFRCTVPAGHYFMMGDNRDNSADSRVWGFVPERNIVGKAFFIWMNFSDLSRIGSFH
jgi:signal peptidase I